MEKICEVKGPDEASVIRSDPAAFSIDFYACIKNDLVRGYHSQTTLKEAQLIRIIISQILVDDRELRPYRITIPELANILGIKPSNMYRDIESLCENLHTRYVSIKRDDGRWENISWVTYSFYDGKYVNIVLSEQIKPYLIQLDKNYLKLQVKEIIGFSSYYGLRLYEILKAEWCYRHRGVTKLNYDVAYLRKMIVDDNTAKTFGHFKEGVLNPAVANINNNPAALFTVSFETARERGGRTITNVIFTIVPKNEEALLTDAVL